MRTIRLLALIVGWSCHLLGVQAEERGVVVEGPATHLPDSRGNWAVVVGVNKFKDQEVHPLSYAVPDAQSIAEELTRPEGLIPQDQIYLHTSGGQREPTRGNILASIKYVVEHAPADGLVLVYLSSHGFLDNQKRSYVMPEDGHLQLLEDTALSVARIQELLGPEYCKAAKRLLIVDACRDNPFKSSRGGGEEVSNSFTEQLRQARGQVTLVSCGPGEVSYEDDQMGHGVFSYFLLDGLRGAAGRDHQGFVTVSTLADYVNQRVEGWCKQARKTRPQTPWIQSEVTRSIPLACPGTAPRIPPLPSPTPPAAVEVVGQSEMGGRVFRGREAPNDPRVGDEWEWPLPDGSYCTLCYIPAGRFKMGTARWEINKIPEWMESSFNLSMNDEGKKMLEWEYPQHEVELPAFWMGKYEVTVSQFRAFTLAMNYETEAERGDGSYAWDTSGKFEKRGGVIWKNPGFSQSDNHPVVCVSWNDSKAFSDWAGVRLPSEAEWEKAARGTDARRFPWGDVDPDGSQCNLADKNTSFNWSLSSIDDGYEYTAPVGIYPKGRSPYGCQDMSGNVWEWCLDWFQEDYYSSSDAGRKAPMCMDDSSGARVCRGGCWVYNPLNVRSARRGRGNPADRDLNQGFRVCKPLD